MEQVRELIGLIKDVKTNGGLVAASFIMRRIQRCKERAHVGFDFKGGTDGTQGRLEVLSRDEVVERAVELFAPLASFRVSGQMRPFNCMNPPPQLTISIVCS